ncbi:hypothetical protein DRN86_02465 [Candidatus Geothermarchaeota archaeon]|nr:MAG: hypothetical protein DRN86_02465 [Candidatus Geothermarchaeota archaeon]
MSKPLIKIGVKPWMLTLFSLILSLLMFFILSSRDGKETRLLLAIILFSISAIFDALDGTLARMTGRVSKLGAFLDSFCDRIGESLVLLGLMIGGFVSWIWGTFFLITSMLISYVRARGEGLNIDLRGIGLMERAERIILILIGSFLWFLHKRALNFMIMLGSLLNFITIIQRVNHIINELKKHS